MKIEFTSQAADTLQIIDTANQLVIVTGEGGCLGLTKDNMWDNDKAIIVKTKISREPSHIHIDHTLLEDDCPVDSVSIDINAQENRLVITEDWESWEEDDTMIVPCSGGQQQEVVDHIVKMLISK